MIIGFLGKGGSGKSTISTEYTRYLASKSIHVLAIDADHNMDMTWQLRGTTDDMRYLGDAMPDLLNHEGRTRTTYAEMLFENPLPSFSFTQPDAFTEKYTYRTKDGIRLMTAGPHNEAVMFGKSCSHVLTTALKAYLPLLKLEPHESVVIDEKAGADGAGTGIVTGMTMAVIIVEQTPQSIKSAMQISELLDFFDVPYEFVINKYQDTRTVPTLPKKPVGLIKFSDNITATAQTVFDEITRKAQEIERKNPNLRYDRSRKKFERNREYKKFQTKKTPGINAPW